jgi:uncharacterized protein (DUF58 family)
MAGAAGKATDAEERKIVVRDIPALEMLGRAVPRKGLFQKLWFMWMYRFTPAGRAVVIATVVAGSTAMAINISFPSYYFAFFLLALFFVGLIVGWLLKPRVSVERALPERCAAGATVRVSARVTNKSRLPVFDLAAREIPLPPVPHLESESEYRNCLRGRETTDLTYTITPKRRGCYDFPGPQVFTVFPFGIYNTFQQVDAPRRMLVYPRFASLEDVRIPVGRRYQPGGLQLVSRVGDSEEFIGNREYQSGDRLRDLHHAAWARLGYPVVREYEQEYLVRIALVVDTYVPRPSMAAERCMEAGISLGAGVAEVLSRLEYVIDVFAAGDRLYHFQAGRSLAFLDNILDVLACIEECRTDPFPLLGPAVIEEIAQISTAIMVFLDWDESRLRFVRQVQEHGVESKVIVVRESAPSLDPAGFAGEAGPVQVFTPEQVEKGVDRL